MNLPSRKSGGATEILVGRRGCIVTAVVSAGVAILAVVTSPPGVDWTAGRVVLAAEALALTALAVTQAITNRFRPKLLVVVALIEAGILLPYLDKPDLHLASMVVIVLAMGGRLLYLDDRRSERPFLAMAFCVWLLSVAFSLLPPGEDWAGSSSHVATQAAVLWLGVSMVGSVMSALRASAARYRGIFDGAPIGLLEENFAAVGRWLEGIPVASADELRDFLAEHPEELRSGIALVRVGEVNQSALAMVGADSRDVFLHGIPATTTTRESVATAFAEQFVAIWEGRNNIDISFTGLKVTGEEFVARLHSSFPEGTEGGIDLEHGVVAITDISPLVEAIRSKDELLAGVSHRLRTPLTGIVGFSRELVTESRLSDDERAQFLAIIAEDADLMGSIIEDLLVAARSDLSDLSLHARRIDMAPYLAQLGFELDITGSGKRLRFGDCEATLSADPMRLKQIIRNLVENAVRYGGDEITIAVTTTDGTACITVSDNGEGVPEDEVEAIFEPYYRITDDSNQPATLGMGLTLSRRLAQAMGGELSYRRRGGETEFLLTLQSPTTCLPIQRLVA